ncbi:unnamed protein product [Parascedosporium putredinis]|uniref:DUF7053 domain-containing protein n=1 Tax=Parascedosporium putredinis TaxID=1442378 RepID=A0A9P1H6Q7_9PEZI|nr:unnamed protein product [Parascedosporium putredinis]CAI7997768.1 unnamed protein product [Parascedosporium putredinis]
MTSLLNTTAALRHATPIPAGVTLEQAIASVQNHEGFIKLTDRVHALPAGLWDSDVVSTYEFTDLEKGMFVRLRSPLSVMMETVWEVREVEGSPGALELVEEVNISCSRLLVGVIKGQCEGNWKGIHEKMVALMEGKDVVKDA